MDKYLQRPSHPTGSLEFLKTLREQQGHKANQQAAVQLRIAVVGAGLAGLATGLGLSRSGHNVTIYEASDVLGEVGAGIQVAPNSTRHLLRWGVDKHLEGLTVEPDCLVTHRWSNGKVIGKLQFKPLMRDTYGAPFYQIHRPDFHEALKKAALEHGAKIVLNRKVVHFDFNKPEITFEDGEKERPDFVVAADGVKSTAREHFLGPNALSNSALTGYAAYWGTLDAAIVRQDPELRWLVERPTQNIWIGHDRHIITYTLRAGTLFNFVLLHPESRSAEEWEQDDVGEQMLRHYKGWDPIVIRLISLIKNPTKWPLMIAEPMTKWASNNGRAIILGDAAHAMVPWMAQGANMAIEDAAALEEVLRLIPSRVDLPQAMKVFESVRIPRTRNMQQASLLNGYLLHLPDGPEQEARDEASRKEVEGTPFITSSQQWSDPSTQFWTYGHRCEDEIRHAWKVARKESGHFFSARL